MCIRDRLVDYSHKVCTLTAADGSASITGTLVDVQDDALTTVSYTHLDPVNASLYDSFVKKI